MKTESCRSGWTLREQVKSDGLTRRTALSAGLAALGSFAWTQDLDGRGQQPPSASDGRRELIRQSLPNAPGKEVVVFRIQFAPGQPPTGRHTHPAPVFGYVARGALVVEFDGQKPTTYREGEMFYEPPRTIHLSTRNASSTEPATLIAFFVADAGQSLTEQVRQ